MKLLWHSNSPIVATGYGNQTAVFAPRLAPLVEEFTISAFRYSGTPIDWNGLEVLPGSIDAHGNDILVSHAHRAFGEPKGGVVIGLHDIWVLKVPIIGALNFASWCPVDHEPAHAGITETIKQGQALPIAMSKFGERMLAEFDPLYVPHGVETDVYKPLDRAECRKKLGIPDGAFVVGLVGANSGRSPNRKALPEAIEGFAHFQRNHPEAILALHTEVTGAAEKSIDAGIDLTELIEELKIPHSSIWLANQYAIGTQAFPASYMVRFYNALDVLLQPSYGEGFGLPIIEAEACGTPVVVNDCTSMPELSASGWLVQGSRYWTPFGAWQLRPDVDSIYDNLAKAYTSGKKERDAARNFALGYDADLITEDYWKPALKQVADHFGF
jgi:glycosyltransferase involved in cell wall biosynthesis